MIEPTHELSESRPMIWATESGEKTLRTALSYHELYNRKAPMFTRDEPDAKSAAPAAGTPKSPRLCRQMQVDAVKGHRFLVDNIKKNYGHDIDCICSQLQVLLHNSKLAQSLSCVSLSVSNLFEKLKDGVLLCAMANLLRPGIVAESSILRPTVKTPPSTMDAIFKSLSKSPLVKSSPIEIVPSPENMNLGLQALRAAGVCISSGDFTLSWDVIVEKSTLYLIGVLLQVLHLATVGRMNLRDNPSLIYMFPDWQDEQQDQLNRVKCMPREILLLHWINYQLRKTGKDLQIENLGKLTLEIYAHLLDVVAPKEKKAVTGASSLTPTATILAEKDPKKQAALVVRNASNLLLDLSLTMFNHLIFPRVTQDDAQSLRMSIINFAFATSIFLAFPNIDEPTDPKSRLDPRTAAALKPSLEPDDSSVWRTAWLNSFGPNPPVIHLGPDLRSGIVLLQVLDAISPGCVDWNRVENRDQPMPQRHVDWLSNCEEVLAILKNLGISVSCSAKDLLECDEKTAIEVVSAMFEEGYVAKRTLPLDGKPQAGKQAAGKPQALTDDLLLGWFNRRVYEFGSTSVFKNLHGNQRPGLGTTNALGFVAERVLQPPCPGDCPCQSKPKLPDFDKLADVSNADEKEIAAATILTLHRGGLAVPTEVLHSNTEVCLYRSLVQQLMLVDAKVKGTANVLAEKDEWKNKGGG